MHLFRFFHKHKFLVATLCILLLAFFLRFIHLDDRWGLAYDQARDVIVAREALRTFDLPLIGPFTSAGQFVYGPQWYWILMLFVSIYPPAVLTPWVIQALLYVGVVFIMMLIGNELKGKWFGLILGLLMAVSTGQISQSLNLTSPSMVGIVAVLAVYVFIRFLKTEKPVLACVLGFIIGTAINIHFQAIGLFFLGIVALVFVRKRRSHSIPLFFLGFLLPFIPLIMFDITNNNFESRNMLDYYLYGQYRTYIPRRWLTYALEFWPLAWARVIGGYFPIALSLISLIGLLVLYRSWKKDLGRYFLAILTFFAINIVLLRYYRGPLYDSYLVSLHPVMIILSGWILYEIVKRFKIIGILALTIVVLGSLFIDINDMKNAVNQAAFRAEGWRNLLITTYPGQKFAVYDYGYESTTYSLPLVLYLQARGDISDDGHKIGFGSKPKVIVQDHPELNRNVYGFRLRDLESSTSAQLKKDGWAFVNPSTIYHSTVKWFEGKEI